MQINIPLDKDFDIEVGAHKIKVKFVDSAKLKEEAEQSPDPTDDTHVYGIWDPETFTIYINKNGPDSMKISTLFHELIHAMEDFFAIKVSHKDLNLIADIIAQCLFSVKRK